MKKLHSGNKKMLIETYNDIYLRVRRKLKAAGISSSDMEAKFIVARCMNKSREELLAMNRMYATDRQVTGKINEAVEKRIKGQPLAYILGEWEFYGLNIIVNEDVLIPRNDTELLAQKAIDLIKKKMRKCRVLDLCTGTGCIGLAIAAKVPGCRVVLADNSDKALAVCRKNTLALNLSKSTTVAPADALKSPPALLGTFDVIVSNPPYIPTGDIENLDNSVKDYEPVQALDGGADGLDYFKTIISLWKEVLEPGGNIALECGIGQAGEVQGILNINKFDNIMIYNDTQGIQRVITGQKPPETAGDSRITNTGG